MHIEPIRDPPCNRPFRCFQHLRGGLTARGELQASAPGIDAQSLHTTSASLFVGLPCRANTCCHSAVWQMAQASGRLRRRGRFRRACGDRPGKGSRKGSRWRRPHLASGRDALSPAVRAPWAPRRLLARSRRQGLQQSPCEAQPGALPGGRRCRHERAARWYDHLRAPARL